jgi:glycerophosphoryl diester phosphodiesterase
MAFEKAKRNQLDGIELDVILANNILGLADKR